MRADSRWTLGGVLVSCIVAGGYGCGAHSDSGGAGASGGSGGGAAGGAAGAAGSRSGGVGLIGFGGSGGSAAGSGASGGGGSGGVGGGVAGTGGGAAGGGGVGAAGSGGAGGGASGERECESAGDCRLVSDCCSCRAAPDDGRPAPACLLACARDACAEAAITSVSCQAGRCVLDVSCDESQVGCDVPTPQCPTGQVPSVSGACYGACVDVLMCREVTSCAVCAGDQACVVYETQLGPEHHCVRPPASCTGKGGCACLGQSVCASPFDACSNSAEGVRCGCPAC